MIDFDYRGILTEKLREGGLDREAAHAKATLLAKAREALPAPLSPHGPQEVTLFYVPGRIEVLGKHTDYAGGRSMVAAAERGFCLAVAPRSDRRVCVIDAIGAESVEFAMTPELTPRAGHWSNYPMTVARRLARNFPTARLGADIAFASDLPPAAGMSSSSALIVGVFLALAEVNDLSAPLDCPDLFSIPLRLAEYLGTVENGQSFGLLHGDRGVGTFGGSEDHTAILCARPGHVSQFAYCPVRFERAIELPEGYVFAVAVSGVVAEKTGAAQEKYNAASRLASTIVDLWRAATGRDDPHLAAILDSSPDAPTRLHKIVAAARDEPAALLARLVHFIMENNEIIPAASETLSQGNLRRFGRMVKRSQQAAERLLGTQVPETIHLAAAARRCGAVAASSFGGGFGGGVWALVEKSRAEAMLRDWATGYRLEFPQHANAAEFFTTAAGPPAFRVG